MGPQLWLSIPLVESLFREGVLVQSDILLPLYVSCTVERHVNCVNVACVCADVCTWNLLRPSLTYVTFEHLYVSSLETEGHFAMCHYQSFAEFQKVKEEAVIFNSVDQFYLCLAHRVIDDSHSCYRLPHCFADWTVGSALQNVSLPAWHCHSLKVFHSVNKWLLHPVII
jgi:hypothetical protein